MRFLFRSSLAIAVLVCRGAPASAQTTQSAAQSPARPSVRPSVKPVALPTFARGGPGTADAVAQQYLARFREYGENHWRTEGAAWTGDYYDRALLWYHAWALTGDPRYRERADSQAKVYRDEYLIRAANYNPSPHWAQLEGVALHAVLTGDTLSRQAVIRSAGRLAGFIPSRYMTAAGGDPRIAARVLHAQALAAQLGDATLPKVQAALDKIVAWQDESGAFNTTLTCGGQLNYMVGLLGDALAKVYDNVLPDPRIVRVVARAADYTWATQWDANARAFRYNSVPCRGVGGPDPAPDLNGLFVSMYGWLWTQTGDARYREMAETIFAADATQGWLSGSKQFNQAYASSFKYLGIR
jgi:hypothetical protein